VEQSLRWRRSTGRRRRSAAEDGSDVGMRFFPCGHVLGQDFHGLVDLGILALGELVGMGLYGYVGRDTHFLHVFALAVVAARAWDAEDRAVDEADGRRADDVGPGRLADELAETEGAESAGEYLGVAVAAVVDEEHKRLGPLAVVRAQDEAGAAVALAENGV